VLCRSPLSLLLLLLPLLLLLLPASPSSPDSRVWSLSMLLVSLPSLLTGATNQQHH
jgi:hypothetical protein